MPTWNLTERLSTSSVRRFHLPVASDPSGGAALPLVAPGRYQVEEAEVDGMPRLQVTVAATAEGFPAEGGLPAAVIRLHAMGNSRLSYRPQLGSLRQCLLLDLSPNWLTMAVLVNWLYRWIEAECIPRTVIYDNVDPEALRARLEAAPINADATIADRLSFPRSVRRQGGSKAWFIDSFMAGEPGAAMSAWQGACLGQMALVTESTSRRLGLTARYQGHSDAAPRPMMPRELFNLFFGVDSPEFVNHPLLRAIQQVGESATTQPVTRRMLLRPPLRTHARVMWEAAQELPDTARWSLTGRLDSTKLLNTVDEFNRLKHYGISPAAPEGVYKCQVFGFEMLLRSGFRVRMHRTPEAGGWRVYYYIVNRIVREARETRDMNASQPAVIGTAGEIPWGRRWDRVLRLLPDGQQAAEINRMIDEEGRAFYLAMEFQGVTRDAAGHFLLLERVEETLPENWLFPHTPYPIAWEDAGDPEKGTLSGLLWILARVYEAPEHGLRRATNLFVPAWDVWFEAANSPHLGEGSNNNDLLLIEALPGPDPHTQGGIRALCAIHQKGP